MLRGYDSCWEDLLEDLKCNRCVFLENRFPGLSLSSGLEIYAQGHHVELDPGLTIRALQAVHLKMIHLESMPLPSHR